MSVKKFVVADDFAIVRKGMASLLRKKYEYSEVDEASTFLEIINLIKIKKIDLLVLDIDFPDGTSLNLIPTIKNIQPDIKILIFSAFEEEIYAIRYLNAGANGYLNKLAAIEEMEEAIDSMLQKGKYLSPEIQNKILDSYILKRPANPLDLLSNREIEIAKLMVDGCGNSVISKNLNIKKTTVSTYKNRIFEKLEISNLSSLIGFFNLYFKSA
ncbi:response regulator transcription factor [Flavobacterium luteolum]|uniref:response regulator transcription factor n=1 Tax=Flavobacterium luteolum TaxID=3003259 RepID=UPI00248E8F65|nr:response regulator transcription factor [Flavobacterium luteolum]